MRKSYRITLIVAALLVIAISIYLLLSERIHSWGGYAIILSMTLVLLAQAVELRK